MSERVVHLGDAGRGAIKCGVAEVKDAYGNKNWTWKPENVTCRKCKALYRKEQHSADLREIAEMAIEGMRKYNNALWKWAAEADVDEEDAPKRPTADSILREFREREVRK